MTQEEIIAEYKRLFSMESVNAGDPRVVALYEHMTDDTIIALIEWHADQFTMISDALERGTKGLN